MGHNTLKRQQHASARHYLDKAVGDTSLQATLTLTANYFGYSMAQVNVLDGEEQHTIVSVGTTLGSIPRGEALCDHVVRSGLPTVLADIDAVPESLLHIRAYVGVPITGREGLIVGTLCLLDTFERPFGDSNMRDLTAVASVIQDQLELLRRLGQTPGGSISDAAELAAAVEAGQIEAFYQPVVSLATGEVFAVEALARWRHPVRGLLYPDTFIPLAEDSEIIIDLDLVVLEKATTDLATWHHAFPDLRMHINLSARHFDHPDCVKRLQDTVLGAGVRPQQVTFEVTETVALAAHPGDRSFLADLGSCGFRVVLDDFGTGFSSMEQVLRLPIDGIKLDRGVAAALGSSVGNAVARALLGLATDLSLETVIEGVESAEQARRAMEFGCQGGQGYLWAPALPAAEFWSYLNAQRCPN